MGFYKISLREMDQRLQGTYSTRIVSFVYTAHEYVFFHLKGLPSIISHWESALGSMFSSIRCFSQCLPSTHIVCIFGFMGVFLEKEGRKVDIS